jgi:hypothetical protein
MNRNVLLVSGVVCWTIAGADALIHLLNGDLLVPTAMLAVFVVWVGLRQWQARHVPVPARISDSA